MTTNGTRNALQQAGCVLEGEYFFPLKTEGLVSMKYINIDPVLTMPGLLRTICDNLMGEFAGEFDCLVGPATGGIPLTYICAAIAVNNDCLGLQARDLRTAFAGKEGQGFVFDRMGFAAAVKRRRVLVVEDISSTGGTTRKVCDLIREAGGDPIGVSMIWNRGNVTAEDIGVPQLHALVEESVKTWQTADNTPPGWGELPLVTDIGHPEYFPDYPGPTIELLAT